MQIRKLTSAPAWGNLEKIRLGGDAVQTFFAPGRTELAGNHTDHQKGRILAAAVDVGITAKVTPISEPLVTIASEGFKPFTVDLRDLEPQEAEKETSAALVRGVAAGIRARGGEICGFEASVSSTIRSGGGLSSSAAFEILMGRIWNGLCNADRFDALTLAIIGQEAENRFFGKPSGLMDQIACATSGAVYVDFASMEVRPIRADFRALGYVLSLTDTGGSHANLTAAYAAVPADMKAVAKALGGELLSDVPEEVFDAQRQDSPVWDRAKHFYDENRRVPQMAEALERGDMETYLRLMNESGRSSEQLLRNIRAAEGDDCLARGLALAASLLEGKGAWRVHGGGFAGCVQALTPIAEFDAYRAAMDAEFGKGACEAIDICV